MLGIRFPWSFSKSVGAFTLALLLVIPGSAAVFPIAISGALSPSGTETFSRLGVPIINDIGRVAFYSELSSQRRGEALFISGEGNSNLGSVASQNSFSPDPERFYRRFFLEDAASDRLIYGDIYVDNLLVPSLTISNGIGFTAYIGRETERYVVVTDSIFTNRSWTANPPMNEKGQILSEVDSQDFQLFEGTNATPIAKVDLANPSASAFSYIGLPALNDRGEVAFLAMPAGEAANPNLREVILVASGTTHKLWKRGDAAPDGNGKFAFARNDALLNNRGEVVFNATLSGTSAGAGDDEGIFCATTNAVRQLLRAGQKVPVGAGVFGGGFHLPSINDKGLMAVFANIAQSGVGGDHGIFTSDGTVVKQIARRGEASPDGKGQFVLEPEEEGWYGEVELNGTGQLAFKAYFGPNGGPYNEEGLIFVEANGTKHLIARKGQSLAGSTIASLRILGENDDIRPINRRGGRKAMNEDGVVVFRATLADARLAICVWRKGVDLPESPAITIANLDNMITLRVPTIRGWSYQIQSSDFVGRTEYWTDMLYPPWRGTGEVLEFNDPVYDFLELRHYRVVVTPGW